ncbi:MAG: hypothetical protein ACI8UR_000642 [Natronomonas sp.]|jgi:hypothetical protein|uniref:hypothetical protein n=1 Tax=Natronomonas sp. TaxID=2184060 RepID=UPI003988E41B
MADDEPRPLLDPRLFTPSEFIGDDMDHNVDVTGDPSVEVNHTIDLEVPRRRIEIGAIIFAVLVALLGTFTPVGPTVQASIAASVVLVGNVLHRRFAV